MTRPKATTKTALLREMLAARDGASLVMLCAATGWQKHSVRAALSGLRKAGHAVERATSTKAGRDAVYRISGTPLAGA